jgi:phosphatidylglycerol:prolipoprotein diacylglycerol transferase
MSFHGGFLGVVVAGLIFCRREKIPALSVGDLFAAVAPIGLFLGRLANFVNAELWGRQTDMPWGVAFPGDLAQLCPGVVGVCARHPSQLYEAALEGLVLFILLTTLIWAYNWLKTPGKIAGLFFAGYGVSRFLVDFVRQPDAQFISDGNPLGLAMIAVGLWFIARRRA